jgi:transposase
LDKIKFKFESTNGVFETVDPYQTAWTQTCSYCGHRATGDDKKTLADRIHRCYNCNVHLNKEIDRDVNSAINAKFWDKQKNCLCVNESKKFISGLHPDALAAKIN